MIIASLSKAETTASNPALSQAVKISEHRHSLVIVTALILTVLVLCEDRFRLQRHYYVDEAAQKTEREKLAEELALVVTKRLEQSNVLVGQSSPGISAATVISSAGDPRPLNSIRYLVTGTSVTYGSGLPDRVHQAYPALLSGLNLGTPGSGPSAMSPCIASYAGEDIYDVIVIEYYGRISSPKETGELALKLRLRFPDAVIIFIRDWYPMKAIAVEGGKRNTLQDWIKQKGLVYARSDQFFLAFKNTVLASPRVNWEWEEPRGTIESYDNIVAQVGGHVLYLPQPTSVKEMWTPVHGRDGYTYADLIGNDLLHWSIKGHKLMAKMIREKVESIQLNPSPRLGEWGFRNVCNNWQLNPENSPEHSDHVKLVLFKEAQGKWSLDFPMEGGTVTLRNPTENALDLYLTFMVTGPPPSMYPAVRLTLHNDGANALPHTCILEQPTKSLLPQKYHITQIAPVGTAYPGDNTLHIIPLENSELPFRAVATIMSNPNGKPEGTIDACRKPSPTEMQAKH